MDTKIIRYFLAVAHYGSYARAAQDFGISPQGLNSSVHRLESELGVTLLSSANGSLRPTPYGKAFLGYAHRLTDILDDMERELQAMRAHEAHVIKLGCAIGVIGYLGEGLIYNFNDRNETQVLLTDEVPDLTCEQRLAAGEYDFCLVTNPVRTSTLMSIPIVSDYHFFWVARRHPLSRKSVIAPADLNGQVVYSMNDEYKATPAFLELCDKAGAHVEMRYTGEMIRVYECARAGHGLGLTCRNHIEATADSTQTVGIPFPALPWGISICYRRDKVLTEGEQSFLDYVRDHRHVYV